MSMIISYRPTRIVSGGQTGADRGALDWAIAHNMPHGGFCPKGRIAEDGVIPPQYRLIQTPSAEYQERTEANVKGSDATLIFIESHANSGSLLTADYCEKLKKPFMYVDPWTSVLSVKEFLDQYKPNALNIAGSRASTAPTIYARVQQMLTDAIGSTPPQEAK